MIRYILLVLVILSISPLFAQDTDRTDVTSTKPADIKDSAMDQSPPKSKGFAHPLQVEPVSVYTKVRGNAGYWDRDFNGTYEEIKNINIEGELKFWENFSVLTSMGRTQVSLTDSPREITWDRANLGLKYAKTFDFGSSQFLIGGGLRVFDRKRNSVFRERENPDYYLVRPNFGFGYKNGIFELLSEFRFQTETNKQARESNLEEFRRYYQIGIAPSIALGESFRVFTEFEYREPFDKVIDTNTRFFNFYPGFSYKTDSVGTFSVSLMAGILPKKENSMDRGIRFSYFYFFDYGN